MISGCTVLCLELLEVQGRAGMIILPFGNFYKLFEWVRQTHTDNRAEQDLIETMDLFSQLVLQEFRRGSDALNPTD